MKNKFKLLATICFVLVPLFMTGCEPEPNPDDPNNNNPNDTANFNLSSFTMNEITGTDEISGDVNQMIVTNDNSFVLTTWQGGVYRSADNGNTWSNVFSASSLGAYGDNLVKAPDGKIYIAISGNGLYVSTNNGISFSALAATGVTFSTMQYGTSLSISPSGDIFLLMHNGPTTDALYRSTDGGNTFNSVSHPTGVSNTNVCYGALKHTPGGSLFMIANNGVYRSDNNGASWSQKWSNVGFAYAYNLHISSTGKVFLSNLSNLFVSDDNGESFSSYTGTIARIVTTMPNGNLVGIKNYSNSNEFVYRSTDNGQSWLSMGNQSGNLQALACNNSYMVGWNNRRSLRLNLNETFWTCKYLPDYPAWTDFDVDGNDIVIAANQQLYYSDNLGESWRIAAFVPWNVYCLDLNNSINRLAVGCGSSTGALPNGLFYILDAKATSILETGYAGNTINVDDIVMSDANSLVFALADPVNIEGLVALTDDYFGGSGTYEYYIPTNANANTLQHRLFHDKWEDRMYMMWLGTAFASSGYQRTKYYATGTNTYFLYPDSALTDFIPIENGYNPGSVMINFARQESLHHLFFIIHGPNDLWYQDDAHLWKHTTLSLSEQVNQMGFDGNGFFWALTDHGLFKSDAIPYIIDQ